MKKLWIIGLLALPLLMTQNANAQTAAKKQTTTKKEVSKSKKTATVKPELKKAGKVKKGDAKGAQSSNDTKGKTPNSKIAVQREGANVKKEKGVEDVE